MSKRKYFCWPNFVRPCESAKAHSTQKSSVFKRMEHESGSRMLTCIPKYYPDNFETGPFYGHSYKLITIKLTIQWESRCDQTYEERNTSTQSSWGSAGNINGTHGYSRSKRYVCSQSACGLMAAVGTNGRDIRGLIQRLGQADECATSWQWLRREEMS